MQASVYVSAKLPLYAKVLFIKFTLIGLCSCVTMMESEDKKKKDDILEAQLAVIVNYLEQGLAQKAHAELRGLQNDNPKNAKVLNLLGLANLALKKGKLAETYFKNAYSLQKDTTYILNLSSAYIEQKRYGAAVNVLKKMIEDGTPDYPYPERIYHNIGLAYENAKKPNTARKYFTKALDINPSYYPTLLQLGRMETAAAKPIQAKNYFEQARQACTNCLAPIQALVVLSQTSGDQRAASHYLQNFLKLKNLLNHDRATAAQMLAQLDEKTSNASTK